MALSISVFQCMFEHPCSVVEGKPDSTTGAADAILHSSRGNTLLCSEALESCRGCGCMLSSGGNHVETDITLLGFGFNKDIPQAPLATVA